MASFDGSYASIVNSYQNFSNALAHESQNIANSNTIGYKRIDTQFVSMVQDVIGSPFREYLGNARISGRNLIDTHGSLVGTQRGLDASIIGNGFFPTRRSLTSGNVMLTSAGRFDKKVVKEGNLEKVYIVNSAGNYLLGWPYNQTTGTYQEGGNVNSLQPVQVDSISNVSNPKPTTKVTASANLPADDPTSNPPSHNMDMTIYDGVTNQEHPLTATFTKAGEGQWLMTLKTGDGVVNSPSGGTLLQFDASGKLTNPKNINVSVSWSSPQAVGSSFNMDISKFTQYGGTDGKFGVKDIQRDGQGSGSLKDVTFGKDGVVTGTFTNGDIRPLYKIPSATVEAPNQMSRSGDTSFEANLASGPIRLEDFAKIDHAKFQPQTLEQSNINSTESIGNSMKYEQYYSMTGNAFQAVQKTTQQAIDLIQS